MTIRVTIGAPRLARPLALGALVAVLLAGCPKAEDPSPLPARKPPRPAAAPEIPERGPLAQRVLYERAKSLLRAGKLPQAAESFRQAIAAHDKGDLLPSAHLGLASALGELGRPQEALREYQRVVELRPDDPEAYRALAIGQEDAGQLQQAAQSLEQSLAIDEDQLSAYQDLASLDLKMKRLEEAKAVYLRYELRRTALIEALALSEDLEERVRAAHALGDAKDEATCKALGLALGTADKKIRLAVIMALGRQGLAIGAGPLREQLARTSDPLERRQIEASLAAIQAAPQPPPQVPPAVSAGAAPSTQPDPTSQPSPGPGAAATTPGGGTR